jgi:hypothetical protein
MLRPAGLIGGEHMAASCAKALRKKFWLHHIWGSREIFATRCLHPVTLALGHDGSSPLDRCGIGLGARELMMVGWQQVA